MFVLSSPSGAGKTTLTKKLAENHPNFKISISHTTRKPRPNEVNGKDYHFIDKKNFDLLIKNKDFFEYAKIFDNYYGTLKTPVLKFLSQEKDVLFDIDWQGTQQLKNIKDLEIVTFLILPPNIKTLKQRLLNRHQGQEELIKQRMKNYIVINDDLEICYNTILKIINSEKQGISKKQNLSSIEQKVKELIS